MKKEKSNLAASVTARLLNRARQTGDDYQTLLTSFCFERFLYRLGVSSVRERFVLKGAMLLRLWSEHAYRATRDLDLLRRGDGSFNAIRADIETICSAEVEPDALVTLTEALRRTFARRRTPVPAEEPIGLTPAYWENGSRAPQVRAFARRAGLTVGPDPGDDILAALRPFLLPVLGELRGAGATPGTWPPGGPWQSLAQVER